MIIGLTGGIACGKSIAAATLEEAGVKIVDADEIAHYMVRYGSDALGKIIDTFGEKVLTPQKTLDRRKLASIVFASAPERMKLERILHPLIIQELLKHVDDARASGEHMTIIAPLLIEANMQDIADVVWVIVTDEKTQVERMMRRDRLGKIEALRRIAAQMPTSEKVKYADYVLENNSTIPAFKKLVQETWERTLADFEARSEKA
jgi:dephospho-CoA kinase